MWLVLSRGSALLCLVLLGCEASGVDSGGGDAREDGFQDENQGLIDTNPPRPDPVVVVEAEPIPCRWEKQTFQCACADGLIGRQTCQGGERTACECTEPVEPYRPDAVKRDPLEGNNRSDITFEWDETPMDTGTCEPGNYQGGFAGSYYSRLNWPAPFPVIGTDIPEKPGLKFKMLPAEPGEVILVVSGKFDGTATGFFPFRGDFEGELNCETGVATAMMLNGEYTIGPDELVFLANPVRFYFEGPVSATYNKLTHSFVGGIWDAIEPEWGGVPFESYPRDPFRDGVGGSGVWSASWIDGKITYKCPATDGAGTPLACQPGPFGLTKTFCVYPALLAGAMRADPPACTQRSDCEAHFPGEDVDCVDLNGDGVWVRCLKECAP